MNITDIRAVSLHIPRPAPQTRPTRPNWNTHAARALPINKYPEFSRLHGQMPGANTSVAVWVQVTAEDGTWGLGQCSFGEPVAALIDYHLGVALFRRRSLDDLQVRSPPGTLGVIRLRGWAET